MLILCHENGYGNIDLKEAREVVDKHLPVGSRDKVILLELLNDYGNLLAVVDGKSNTIFRHPDGSETRRLKLY